MKILYLTHGLPPERVGGVELHVHQLARRVGERHEVEALIPTDDPALAPFTWKRDELGGVPVVRMRTERNRLRFDELYWNPRVDAAFEKLLEESRPDLVHAHSLIGLSFGMLEIAARRGIPTLMSLHDFFTVCPLGQRIRRDLDLCLTIDRERCARCLRPSLAEGMAGHSGFGRWIGGARALAEAAIKSPGPERLLAHDRRMRRLFAAIDRIVTPSNFVRDEFLAYGVDPERIRALPWGFERGRLREASAMRTTSDRVRVGYLGSVIPTKGAHVLLEAFAGLPSGIATLEIHGEIPRFQGGDDYARGIERTVAGTEGVTVHGRYEPGELPKILAGMDVLVVPSIWFETFCITIREGFLAGVPVLASRLGAMAEAIDDGRNGMLFEPGDPIDLREKLELLVRDPQLRARLADAPKSVKGIDENAGEFLGIYEELVARP